MTSAVAILGGLIIGLPFLMLGMFIVWLIRRHGGAVALPAISGQTVGGIVGGIVLISLMVSSTLPWQTWLMLVGAGVIAYLFRTSMLGRVAAGILLSFGVGYGLFHGVYGDEAGKVAEANRKALAEAATKASSPTTPKSQPAQAAGQAVSPATAPSELSAPQAAVVAAQTEFGTIKDAPDSAWSPPLGTARGQCFLAWTNSYGKPTERVQWTRSEKPDLADDSKDWQEVEPNKFVSTAYAKWWRVRSKGPGPTDIRYTIKPQGTC